MRPWLTAFVSAFLFGIATPLSKVLLAEAHPFLLAALFYLGAALILLPKSISLQRKSPIRRLSRSDAWNLMGSLFFGGMVGPVCLLFGLRYTAAITASLLLNLETPTTALIAYWFFKENIGRRVAVSNLGIVAAGIILTLEGSLVPGAGGVLIALACIAWGLDNNHTASIHDLDPIRCTFLKGITFGSVNLGIAALMTSTNPSTGTILFALGIGAVSYGVSIVLYIHSARGLGAARSQMVFASAPFFGVMISQIYLGERFHLFQAAGAATMAAMLILLFTEKHSHFHMHPFIEHIHRHHHEDGHHDHLHEGKGAENITHTHRHTHESGSHAHPHHPDIHHRHKH